MATTTATTPATTATTPATTATTPATSETMPASKVIAPEEWMAQMQPALEEAFAGAVNAAAAVQPKGSELMKFLSQHFAEQAPTPSPSPLPTVKQQSSRAFKKEVPVEEQVAAAVAAEKKKTDQRVAAA
eukprot:4179123-Prymnesium_polylepis.1